MFYPQIPDSVVLTLKAILLGIKNDENYLNHANCPYSDDFKAVLRDFGSNNGESGAVSTVFDPNLSKIDVILLEIERTVDEMNALEKNVPVEDRVNYYKAKTGLLDKWISMKERIINIKEMDEFQKIILAFMNDVLEKDQIMELKKRLRGLESVDVNVD